MTDGSLHLSKPFASWERMVKDLIVDQCFLWKSSSEAMGAIA
jgi:hypothetical protein